MRKRKLVLHKFMQLRNSLRDVDELNALRDLYAQMVQASFDPIPKETLRVILKNKEDVLLNFEEQTKFYAAISELREYVIDVFGLNFSLVTKKHALFIFYDVMGCDYASIITVGDQSDKEYVISRGDGVILSLEDDKYEAVNIEELESNAEAIEVCIRVFENSAAADFSSYNYYKVTLVSKYSTEIAYIPAKRWYNLIDYITQA